MKKILLVAFCASLFAVPTVSAQKQAGKEGNLQVLFAPLGGSPISINGISYRKFNADGKKALRLNVFLGMTNKTEVITQAIDTGTFATGGGRPEGDKKSSSFTIGLRPGYEWHCPGTDRLSPYCGVEVLFSLTSTKVEADSVKNNVTASTAATDYKVLTIEQKGKGASTSFGLNLIAGADYYIAKNLSLGVELGFGFSMTTMPDIESERVDVTSPTDVTWVVKENALEKQGKEMQVGPNAVAQLKLGWLF